LTFADADRVTIEQAVYRTDDLAYVLECLTLFQGFSCAWMLLVRHLRRRFIHHLFLCNQSEKTQCSKRRKFVLAAFNLGIV